MAAKSQSILVGLATGVGLVATFFLGRSYIRDEVRRVTDDMISQKATNAVSKAVADSIRENVAEKFTNSKLDAICKEEGNKVAKHASDAMLKIDKRVGQELDARLNTLNKDINKAIQEAIKARFSEFFTKAMFNTFSGSERSTYGEG